MGSRAKTRSRDVRSLLVLALVRLLVVIPVAVAVAVYVAVVVIKAHNSHAGINLLYRSLLKSTVSVISIMCRLIREC